METEKKDALIRTLPVVMFALITGIIRFNSYLLSGNLTVLTAFILVVSGVGILTYFGMLFRIKDTKRSEELTSDEFFEMQKRRMRYFLMFSSIMLIIMLVMFDSILKLDLVFVMIFVFIYLMFISMLVFAWYKGAKKMAEEKSKEKINFVSK